MNSSDFGRFLNSASDEEERIASGKLFQTEVAAAQNDSVADGSVVVDEDDRSR